MKLIQAITWINAAISARIPKKVGLTGVVAPDKFKGSATAEQAAAALAAGLRRVMPGLDIAEVPVADGGDGTVAAALAAGFTPQRVSAEGPVGEQVETTVAIKDGVAVIELADIAGLRRLPAGFAPLAASTFGVGQVIAAALAGRDEQAGPRRSCWVSAAAPRPTVAPGWCRRSGCG